MAAPAPGNPVAVAGVSKDPADPAGVSETAGNDSKSKSTSPVAVAGVSKDPADPAGVSETAGNDSKSKSTSGSENNKNNKPETYNDAGSTRHQDNGGHEKSSHKSSHKSSSDNHSGHD
ncbi:MAG: hypothetical protein JJD96_09425 [Thermoleophilia bacterium]|nr:hypothetical protein [Thermoleophilia bacterium]